MGKIMNRLNDFFEQLPERLRRRKFFVLLFFLSLTIVLGAGMNKIVMNNSLDSFFKEDDPVKREYDKFKMVFGGRNTSRLTNSINYHNNHI